MNKLTATQPVNRAEPIDDKWLQIIGTPVAVLPFVFFSLQEYGYGQLLVTNPIQRKPLRVTATPIGLGTLTDRFCRLGLPALEIKDDGEEFRVTVPLVRR